MIKNGPSRYENGPWGHDVYPEAIGVLFKDSVAPTNESLILYDYSYSYSLTSSFV